MPLKHEHLVALRQVCRALEPHGGDWNGASGALEGTVPLNNDLYGALDLLIRDKVLDDTVKIDGKYSDWSKIQPNPSIRAGLELPVTDWASDEHVIYRSLDALIGRGYFLMQAPTGCYLIDEDTLVPEEPGNDRVQNYLRAVRLADLLWKQADHLDRSEGTLRLVFLHKASLTVSVAYRADDLDLPIEGLEALESLLESGEHKEQKRSILKATLYDLLASKADPDQRFRRLLRNLSNLAREFRERYQLFVCEFDFEEVRKELEEKRRDYLVRLNATFHDMGAKLLSVPVAFYLAVTKMEPLPSTGSPFEALVLNTVVALAVVLVGLYIWMLLNSHRHTLDATGDEYTALLTRWQSRLRFAEQKEEVKQTHQILDKRLRRLLTYFRITSWTVIGTVVITLGLYLMRLFRWEAAIWDGLKAIKAMLIAMSGSGL